MNLHACCHQPAAREEPRPLSLLQRFRHTARWIVPGAILVAMPKCPACVAAYVALATGIGISLPAAAQLRVVMLTLCLAALILLTARWVYSTGDRKL